jgi:hypothetical protein
MLFSAPFIGLDELTAKTGWHLQAEGLCREEVCVPLPATALHDGQVELEPVARALHMPLVHDGDAGLWALGPPASEHVWHSAEAPDLVLPDLDGRPFALASLRGKKVLLLAWASW